MILDFFEFSARWLLSYLYHCSPSRRRHTIRNFRAATPRSQPLLINNPAATLKIQVLRLGPIGPLPERSCLLYWGARGRAECWFLLWGQKWGRWVRWREAAGEGVFVLIIHSEFFYVILITKMVK